MSKAATLFPVKAPLPSSSSSSPQLHKQAKKMKSSHNNHLCNKKTYKIEEKGFFCVSSFKNTETRKIRQKESTNRSLSFRGGAGATNKKVSSNNPTSNQTGLISFSPHSKSSIKLPSKILFAKLGEYVSITYPVIPGSQKPNFDRSHVGGDGCSVLKSTSTSSQTDIPWLDGKNRAGNLPQSGQPSGGSKVLYARSGEFLSITPKTYLLPHSTNITCSAVEEPRLLSFRNRQSNQLLKLDSRIVIPQATTTNLDVMTIVENEVNSNTRIKYSRAFFLSIQPKKIRKNEQVKRNRNFSCSSSPFTYPWTKLEGTETIKGLGMKRKYIEEDSIRNKRRKLTGKDALSTDNPTVECQSDNQDMNQRRDFDFQDSPPRRVIDKNWRSWLTSVTSDNHKEIHTDNRVSGHKRKQLDTARPNNEEPQPKRQKLNCPSDLTSPPASHLFETKRKFPETMKLPNDAPKTKRQATRRFTKYRPHKVLSFVELIRPITGNI